MKSETFFIIGLSSLLLIGRNFQISGIRQLILTESPAACGLWCRRRASVETRWTLYCRHVFILQSLRKDCMPSNLNRTDPDSMFTSPTAKT